MSPYFNSKFEKTNDKIKGQIADLQARMDQTDDDDEKRRLAREIKSLNSTKIKMPQPLSLRKSLIPKYVTIDTSTLITLFAEYGKKRRQLGKGMKENRQEIWNRYFNLDQRIFRQKGFRFNYLIETDGIGCSLLFVNERIPDMKYGQKIPKSEPKLPKLGLTLTI